MKENPNEAIQFSIGPDKAGEDFCPFATSLVPDAPNRSLREQKPLCRVAKTLFDFQRGTISKKIKRLNGL